MGYGDGALYYSKKRKLWFAAVEDGWNDKGKRKRRVVSSKTRNGARQKLEKLRKEMAAGVLSDNPTVKAYTDKWLERKKVQVRPSTYSNLKTSCLFLIEGYGSKRISDVTGRDLENLGYTLVEKKRVAASTAGMYQARWSSVFREAQRDGIYIHPDTLAFKKVRNEFPSRVSIPKEQVGKLLTQARNMPGGVRWGLALILGLRQGEALGLRWEDIDFDKKQLRVEWQLQRGNGEIPATMEVIPLTDTAYLSRPKTWSGRRVIPLTDSMNEWLFDWSMKAPRNEWGLVFTGRHGPLLDGVDRNHWVELQNLAQVHKPDGKTYLLHEARHTAATLMLEAGVLPVTVAAIMGHSDVQQQAVYQHPGEKLQLEAITKVEGLIGK